MNITKNDLKVLMELDSNSRIPITQISKNLKLTKDKVNYSIKKLEEEGIIKGYYTLIDYSKIGFMMFKIKVKIKKNKINELIEFLKEISTVSFVTLLNSKEYNIIINFREKNIKEFWVNYKKIIFSFGEEILSKNVSIPINYHFLSWNSKNKITTSNSLEVFSLNDSEKYLIEKISDNARISFVELSKNYDKNPNTLLYTLRSLEKKNIIVGYRVNINWEKLGYHHYKLYFHLSNNNEEYENLIKTLQNIENILHISEGIMDSDLEIDGVFKNEYETIELINKLFEKFPGIEKVEHDLIRKIFRINFFPKI